MKQMPGKVLMVTGAVLISGALAMAQEQRPMSPQQQTNPGLNAPATQQPGAMQQQQQMQNPAMQRMQDKDFVHTAMQGSMAEVQLGQLAEQKASSPDVKQFAQKMTQDHAQLNQQMKPIAQQLGVRTPKRLSKKAEKTDAKLQALSGTQFDNAYIKAMVKDHENDLSEFRHEAQSTQDPALKQAAQQGARVIEQHLAMIKQIAKDHGVKA